MTPLQSFVAAIALVLAGICVGMWACDKQCQPAAEVRR